MKKFRALTASILASAMAMSMATGFAAFAEGEDGGVDAPEVSAEPAKAPENITKKDNNLYTVSISNIAGDTAAHSYAAYKIFDADVTEDNGTEKLTITDWATGVKSADLLTALKTDSAFVVDGENIFDSAESAADVADVLAKNFKKDDPSIQKFAKVVVDYLGDATKEVSGTAGSVFTDIEVGTAGYYLIKETGNLKDKHSAMTRYILTPTNTTNPTAKADYPEITKKIDDNGKLVDFNTASIGDTVTYQLTSRVPDMTGYNRYYYIVNDELFEGLDLNKESFKVTIGDKTKIDATLTKVDPPTADGVADTEVKAEFYVNTGTATKTINGKEEKFTKIEIVFEDFLQYKDLKDKDIIITYEATLNDKAKVGSEGNPNFVDLTFSNNPNYDYEGNKVPDKPDEPTPETPDDPTTPEDESKPGTPMGKTPEDEVITYTTGIELTKVDASDTSKRLTGAEFSIEGNGINWVVKKSKSFVADPTGTYYKLKDGTYTETAPAEGTEDSYVDTTTYKCTETATVLNKDTGKTLVENLAVDGEGVLRINGLNAGTYTIKETKQPDGYILKENPIEITISADPSLETCEWTYESDDLDTEINEPGKNAQGIYTFKITNPKGVVLPGTGAFGTKLMYVLGTIFTATGAAYMISKKSKKEEE